MDMQQDASAANALDMNMDQMITEMDAAAAIATMEGQEEEITSLDANVETVCDMDLSLLLLMSAMLAMVLVPQIHMLKINR